MSVGQRTSMDWPAIMRLGIGVLGMPPDDLWSMTPGELIAVLPVDSPDAQNVMNRSAFNALIARWPDDSPAKDSHAGN